MTITELDSLRADTMRVLLTEEGQRCIWQYDVIPARAALLEALSDYNFDNIEFGRQARRDGHLYALIGPGICDHYFTTPEQLVALVQWLCRDGYLSCYWNRGC